MTKPLLVVLSGPSGVGKDAVLKRMKEQGFPLYYAITATTRPPRPTESDGVDYYFLSPERFAEMRQKGELLEWAYVYGYWYGVPRGPIDEARERGEDVIIKVDVQGAATIKRLIPEAILIFLAPPSLEELGERLRERSTEEAAALEQRLKTAAEEMKCQPWFNYTVVNRRGELDQAVEQIKAIIATEKRPSNHFLSIIIPAYQEERRIGATLGQVITYIEKSGLSTEVIVVDDGSSDRTAALVEALSHCYPFIHLIRNPHRGKGYAVKTGMLRAKGQYRFFCDADLSMPIEQIDRFLPPQLSHYDVAIGSREVAGARRFNEPCSRYLMGRVFNLVVRLMLVPRIRDTQCGFKCFRAEAAQRLFPLQRIAGFGFDIEILFLAQQHHLRIVEVPIDWYYNRESKVKPLSDSLSMLGEALAVRWNYLRGRYQQ